MTNIDVDELTIDQVRRDAADSGVLSGIRQEVSKLEHGIRDHDMARAANAALRDLSESKPWQDLQKMLQEKESQAIEAMRTVDDIEPIVVARLQGHLYTIRLMTRRLTPQALADMDEVDTISRRRLDQLTRLLPKRGPR